jgi:hypothetical protein
MPMFLGMILVAALTVLTVFMVDSMTPTSVAGAAPGVETRQMVNWDVVGVRVKGLRDELRQFGARVQDGWHKVAG